MSSPSCQTVFARDMLQGILYAIARPSVRPSVCLSVNSHPATATTATITISSTPGYLCWRASKSVLLISTAAGPSRPRQVGVVIHHERNDSVCSEYRLERVCLHTQDIVPSVMWYVGLSPGAVLGKIFLGAWPLIIWEATTVVGDPFTILTTSRTTVSNCPVLSNLCTTYAP